MKGHTVVTGISALCVYCGSSNGADPAYLEAARRVGREAASRDIGIVFGGGRVGMMGAVADGALETGGEVIGIIPGHLQEQEVGHDGLTRLEIVDSMHVRKMRMFELSDAFCALPGGLGTLDETFEIVTWKQLGLHDAPVLLVNLGGYWDPLLEMVAHQAAAGFVRPQHQHLFQVVDGIEALFEVLETAEPPRLKVDSRKL